MTAALRLPAPFPLCALAAACLWAAPAAAAPALDGVEVTLQQKDGLLVSIVSRDGVATTQLGADGRPVRGAILRYSDEQVFGLDYATSSFQALSLAAAVQRKVDERSRFAQSAIPELGIVPQPLYPQAVLSPTPLIRRIAGERARAFLLRTGTAEYRLWYAEALPRAPARVAQALAALGADHCAPPGRSSREGEDDDEDADEDEERHDASGCSAARSAAGRTLLLVQERKGEDFVPVASASAVRRVHVGAGAFDPPQGWTLQARSLVRASPSTTSANVIQGSGPVSDHPQLFVFFWGSRFADAASTRNVGALTSAISGMLEGYVDPLAQYGVTKSHFGGWWVRADDPPTGAGSGSAFLTVANFVVDRSHDTSAPSFWWYEGDDSPIYAVLLDKDKVDQSGWGGFHLDAPTFADQILPFPVNLFAHDLMPYLIAKIPETALSMPPEAQLYRQSCLHDRSPSYCASVLAGLDGFDEGTENVSHELVETMTDPVPFTGWADWLKVPIWERGEIADICDFDLYPWGKRTIYGGTMVKTYWSQLTLSCIPGSLPRVKLLEPADGAQLTFHAGGASTPLRAWATDPIEGVLSDSVRWQVDGRGLFTAGDTVAKGLALGSHTIVATVTDQAGLVATASAQITVVAKPPEVTIFAPLDGSGHPADELLILRGEANDPQDGPLPDSDLRWTLNGSGVGEGRLVTARVNGPGPATIELTATDSAGLSATATVQVQITAPTGNPSVSIQRPLANDSFPVGTVIDFLAYGYNADGTPLPDSAFVWIDDIDGTLGTGARVAHTLSGSSNAPVVHHVKVIVTDPNGRTSSDTVVVYSGTIG